jgi:hypothetical protein
MGPKYHFACACACTTLQLMLSWALQVHTYTLTHTHTYVCIWSTTRAAETTPKIMRPEKGTAVIVVVVVVDGDSPACGTFSRSFRFPSKTVDCLKPPSLPPPPDIHTYIHTYMHAYIHTIILHHSTSHSQASGFANTECKFANVCKCHVFSFLSFLLEKNKS